MRQSQKMEAIGTMAGGIAHDFNNVLGAILGYGELAQQNAAKGSALRPLSRQRHACGGARSAPGRRNPRLSRSGLSERAPVNIGSVVSETLELLKASLPDGIRIESRIAAGDAAVIGDATYLHQVTMNLCTNAIQAMERGGVLGVILERIDVQESRIALARHADAGSVCAPHRQRYRHRPTACRAGTDVRSVFHHQECRRRHRSGPVAGAWHCRRLGRRIEVTTEAGDGTCFEIWLPVAGEISAPVLENDPMLPHGKGEGL